MKVIIASNFVTSILVDDEDYFWLNRFPWGIQTDDAGNEYAIYTLPENHKTLRMHREIFSKHNPNISSDVIDHIDGNGLNNQKNNLRPATLNQNNWNRKLSKNNKSGFKGITWNKDAFEVYIGYYGTKIYLGRSKNILEAIALRKAADIKYHGEFARK